MEGPPRLAEVPEDDEGELDSKRPLSPGEKVIGRSIELSLRGESKANEIREESKLRELSRRVVLPRVVSGEGAPQDSKEKNTAAERINDRIEHSVDAEPNSLIIDRKPEQKSSPKEQEVDIEQPSVREAEFDKRHEVRGEGPIQDFDGHEEQREGVSSDMHHISEVIKDRTKNISETSVPMQRGYSKDRKSPLQRQSFYRSTSYGNAVYAGVAGGIVIILIILLIYLIN